MTITVGNPPTAATTAQIAQLKSDLGLAVMNCTAAELEALAETNVTPTIIPTAPFPKYYIASDDITRTWLVTSTTSATETTVQPLYKNITSVTAGTVSNTSPTLVQSADTLGFLRFTFRLKNLDADPLTKLLLGWRDSPSDSWEYTHGSGYGSYLTSVGGVTTVVDDGFLINITGPRDPNILQQNESCTILFRCEGKRYWGVFAQVSGAADGTVDFNSARLLRGT